MRVTVSLQYWTNSNIHAMHAPLTPAPPLPPGLRLVAVIRTQACSLVCTYVYCSDVPVPMLRE